MLATSGRKEDPEQTDESEDTVSDTDRPKMDLSENMPTSQSNALSKNPHHSIPVEVEEEDDYPKAPEARKSLPTKFHLEQSKTMKKRI